MRAWRGRAARRTATADRQLKQRSNFDGLEPRPKTTHFRRERKADLQAAPASRWRRFRPLRRAVSPPDDSGREPLEAV